MQHPEETDLGPPMFPVAGDGGERFRRRAEQDAVDRFFVIESDAGDLFRNGEYDVEIFDRQQFSPPAFEPLCPLRVLALRAVAVTAGVVSDAAVIAMAAFFGMAAQRGGTAALDGAHDAQLCERQRMAAAVSFAVLPENIGQLKGRPGHCYRRGGTMRSSGLAVFAMVLGETAV